VSETLKFYGASGQQSKARVMEEQLRRCAPDSLEYAKALADAGRHHDAAAALEQTLTHNPFHRNALRMLVQQLVLAEDIDRARARAKQLAALAHHSRKFTTMACDPALVIDSSSARATSFTSGKDFYSPYRRDAASMVTTSNAGELKAGRVLVLQDGVLHILSDGAASLYTHRVWRLGSKEVINLYGQISIPRGADLLELRTIKAGGQIMEPELPPGRGSISMPALEPGDSVEEEYVTHYADWSELPARAFEFGSTDAQVLHTRFVVIGPRSSAITLAELNGAPHPRIEVSGNEIIRVWEVDNVAGVSEEPFGRSGDLLPYIAIKDQEHSIDRLRDTLIESTRIGPHVIDAALAQKFDPTLTEREKARRLYRFVTSRIESTGPSLQASSAEDALSSGEGSRTAALFATARASGLRAELLMAQPLESSCTQTLDPNCFTEPLVRFFVNGETVDADAEADNLPFGAIPSTLNPQSALLVPLQTGATPHMQLVELPARATRQKSIGEGDLFLQGDGSLAASIHIRLGTERGREIRRVLHSSSFSDHDRQTFFDQFAAGILPGAINVRGEASNLGDPDQPLELQMTCTVPQFMATEAGVKSIGQLSPVLGLPGALSATANRKSALYLDTPLSESTVFHLHLPPRFSTLALPQDFSSYSEFGSYAVNFSWSGGQLTVKREFEIPAQIVEPDAFAAFANFVRGISAAERQQINLVFNEPTKTHVSAVAKQ
jgi:cellulose synthase operon protein C